MVLFQKVVHVAAMGVMAIDTEHAAADDFIVHRCRKSFFFVAFETDRFQALP